MTGLAGKSFIVTGGGSGIGRSVVFALIEAGALVTVADINASAAVDVVAEAIGRGGDAKAFTVDVAKEAQIAAMVQHAVVSFGRLDGACNAAGMGPLGKVLHETTLEEWDRRHAINLRGLFLSMKHEIPAMLAAGGGAIVNIGSTAGIRGFHNCAEYCASKAGVMGLVRAAAIDYATSGIRVNAVLPGATATPMMAAFLDADPQREALLAASHPMGRLGKPGEIAAAVSWLLSDEASFVTGIGLPVDGGHSAS